MANDHLYEFGKWLYRLHESDVLIANRLSVFELHKDFHIETAKILELAINKMRDEALTRIESGSTYIQLTRNLVLAMHNWKNLID